MIYDTIIVGAGIAGLYSAHLLRKLHPKSSFLILESGDESKIGGRARTEMFQGTPISIGAGIGRKNKDLLLLKLMDDLNVRYNEFPVVSDYASCACSAHYVKAIFSFLKKTYEKWKKVGDLHSTPRPTFKEFALCFLNKTEYENFRSCAGYTDYENSDIEDVLYNYGFEDNFTTWVGVGISWKNLINAMVTKIGRRHIHTSSHVTKISREEHGVSKTPEFILHTSKQTYRCRKIILATTIESVMNLLPNAKNEHGIYRQIHGQPFLRIYGEFDEASRQILKTRIPHTSVVPGPIHKIIPINADKGIYMIVYTDNADAEKLKKQSKNREFLAREVEKAVGLPRNTLKLSKTADYYWDIGTHYYEPLKGPFKDRADFLHSVQRPSEGILLVGEMVSLHQGWVEGALESVEAVF
jgi:hypothetical protein